MAKSTISTLLAEEMRRSALSTRDVARESAVSHTTVVRVLRGKAVSVKTLQNLARFLKIPPGVIFEESESDIDALAKEVAVLLSKEPALADILNRAVAETRNGDIPQDVLREIIRYASWRLDEATTTSRGADEKRATSKGNRK